MKLRRTRNGGWSLGGAPVADGERIELLFPGGWRPVVVQLPRGGGRPLGLSDAGGGITIPARAHVRWPGGRDVAREAKAARRARWRLRVGLWALARFLRGVARAVRPGRCAVKPLDEYPPDVAAAACCSWRRWRPT